MTNYDCDTLLMIGSGFPYSQFLLKEGSARGVQNDIEREVAGIAAHDALCWRHIRSVRDPWKGKLVIKGILSPADVALARDCGADGNILSNHGSRQLDQDQRAGAGRGSDGYDR